MKRPLFIFILLLTIGAPKELFGGESTYNGSRKIIYDSFEFDFGLTTFMGDVAYRYGEDSETAVTFTYTKGFDPVFSGFGRLSIGKLTGKKTFADQFFESNYIGLSAGPEINFLSLMGFDTGDAFFNLHFKPELGLMKFKTTSYFLNENLRSEENQIELFVGMGVEGKFKIARDWMINLELTANFLNTDNLDSFEGSTGIKDMFYYTSIGAAYILKTNYKRTKYNYKRKAIRRRR